MKADQIPGPSQPRRNANDLLPGGAPASAGWPAEEPRRVGSSATRTPGLLLKRTIVGNITPDGVSGGEAAGATSTSQPASGAVANLGDFRGDSNRGEDDKAEAYSTSKAEELARAKGAETAAKKLAAIRKKVRAIDWDRSLTPAEKREAINEYNAEAQAVVEEQTALYRAAKKSYPRAGIAGAHE